MSNPIVVPSPINNQGHPVSGTTQRVFTQDTPATIWTITHNYGRIPSLTVIDSLGNVLSIGTNLGIKNNIADAVLTITTATITFPAPTVGKVILS